MIASIFCVKYVARVIFLLLISQITLCYAQGQELQFIRDEEIESVLHDMIAPLWEKAKLPIKDLDLHLIVDPNLNAFVTPGMHMFIHTGLLLEAEDPDMALGVLAHETGHVVHGHVSKRIEALGKASYAAYASAILGLATAIVNPEAGIAILNGGMHATERHFLAFSRRQEEIADKEALSLLASIHHSAKGFLKILEKMRKEQMFHNDETNAYNYTHPLGTDRILTVRQRIQEDPFSDQKMEASLKKRYERARIKVKAFLGDSEKLLVHYPLKDDTDVAHYARSILYHRSGRTKEALHAINILIVRCPNDPFYHELKGQILFETGRIEEAITAYRKTRTLLPHSSLMAMQLAFALMTSDEASTIPTKKNEEAIHLLRDIVTKEPENAAGWRQLATAYGKENNKGCSYLALAEEASLLNEVENAIKFSKLAKQHLQKNSPAFRNAKDILSLVDKADEKG